MDKRIKASLGYIQNNLNQPLDLEQLAEQASLSPNYFHRLFKRHVGATPRSYVEEKKLEAAQHLLLNSKEQVQDIALQLGYADYETFSRAYKKYFSLCPEDVRNIGIGASEDGKYKVVSIDATTEEEVMKQIMNHPEFQSKVLSGEIKDFGVAVATKIKGSSSKKRGNGKYKMDYNADLSKELKKLVKA